MSHQHRPHRAGTPGRFDINGVEWWACDPYPTWYRIVDGVLHTPYGNNLGGVHEIPAQWADGGEEERERVRKDKLYLSLLGAREKLCVGQMLVPDDYKSLIEEAIFRIDTCGSELVPEVWSRHDQPMKSDT